MTAIAQGEVKVEDLVDKRLNDDTEDTGEVRAAAKQYYVGLVQEDMELNEGMALNESLDGNELAVIGFLRGYDACLRNHS